MVNYNLSTYQNLELIQWIHQDRSQSNTIRLRQKPSWNNFFFLPVSRPLTYYNDKTWKLENNFERKMANVRLRHLDRLSKYLTSTFRWSFGIL